MQINLEAQPPHISCACTLKTFAYKGLYTDNSKTWKPVTIKGPTKDRGETPVAFRDYGDTVLIPSDRLKKEEKKDVFFTLEQVFNVAANGNTIEVKHKDCVVHLMRDSIKVKTDITVR